MLRSLAARSILCLSWLLATPFSVRADVKLPALIDDHMMVQRDVKVPVWGWAEPGEQVMVTLGEHKGTATPDQDGRWKVLLGPFKAGGPLEMTVAGKNTITVKDILVGDVWVCTGQSNMFIRNRVSNRSQIRLFSAGREKMMLEPQENVPGNWKVCGPKTAYEFSAVGFFFARELHDQLSIPIGMIYANISDPVLGMSRAAQEADAQFKKQFLVPFDEKLSKYREAKRSYDEQLIEWQKAADKAKADGKPVPPKPTLPLRDPLDEGRVPAGTFNANIAPLTPFAIKGVLYYQGEYDAHFDPTGYAKRFPALIRDWRHAWGRDDLPFVYCQLPNYHQEQVQPVEPTGWTTVREAQRKTLDLPHTAMAITLDIGDPNDIHPVNKEPFGRRLAWAALGTVYGKDIVYSGPLYTSMTLDGGKVRLRFKHVGGGLVTKGSETLKGFAVAGDDKKFHWASARIDGDAVVVESDGVAKPVAVRYAWADNPVGNLSNKDGLPAAPFRTDDWSDAELKKGK